MIFANSLFIFLTTILLINDFNIALENPVDSTENIYIGALVKRYFIQESSLWNQIKAGETKTNILISKIHDVHNDFFSTENFVYDISEREQLYFVEYFDHTAYIAYQRDRKSALISNVLFGDYNSTLMDNLFDEIKKVL